MRECIDTILAARDEVRPTASIDLGYLAGNLYVGEPSWDVGDQCLFGSADRIAESLQQARRLGCTVLHVRFRSRSCDELCDQISAFGTDVAPLLDA
jgi:hypothetical protein